MNNSSKQSKAANLRQKAETLLRINSAETGLPLSETETLKLIHELEVHQIELEMQNDELMLASSAAQEAAKKYSELYDFAPSGFFTLSKEGKVIELNLSGAKMLGKERCRLKNSQFGFFVSNDTKPIFNRFLEKVFNSKVKNSCEVILSVNDNILMYVQLTGNAIKNGEQCLLTIIEITERKQTEEKLREQSDAMEAAIDGLAILDADQNYIYMNKSHAGIYGYDNASELIGASWRILYNTGELQRFDQEIMQELRQKGHYQGRALGKKKDGSIFSQDLSLTALENGGMICTVRDITERKRTEHELIIANKELVFQNKEKEKRAAELIIANKELVFQNEEKEKRAAELTRSKQILEETGRLGKVGGWEIDLKKNELFWSDIVYQIHEVDPDYQPTVESAINFYSPESILVISEAVSQAINEGQSFDVELQLITAKQNRIWVRAIGQAYRVNGEIVKIGGVFQDINKRKRAEQELIIANKELVFQNEEKEKRAVELIIAKEKAEESDRLKTAFLYNISHEIRTPFNGILGFLSILQDHDLSDDEREEYTGIINQSADRLMNTINEIVEISQIQAGQMQVTASEINIKMLTGKLVDQFKSFTESKKLKFNINNELPGNLTVIFTDSIKLKAILSNLVGNAFKFTKAGSIELEIRQKGDYLEFSIKDSGIGFPENKIKLIFERFMQADVSKTREFEGLGLGLSIATAYVKMLGGEIWAKSEEGKGSTFFFTIKCNIKPE